MLALHRAERRQEQEALPRRLRDVRFVSALLCLQFWLNLFRSCTEENGATFLHCFKRGGCEGSCASFPAGVPASFECAECRDEGECAYVCSALLFSFQCCVLLSCLFLCAASLFPSNSHATSVHLSFPDLCLVCTFARAGSGDGSWFECPKCEVLNCSQHSWLQCCCGAERRDNIVGCKVRARPFVRSRFRRSGRSNNLASFFYVRSCPSRLRLLIRFP